MLTAASDECVLDFREIVEVVQIRLDPSSDYTDSFTLLCNLWMGSLVDQAQPVECKRFVNLFNEL